MKDMLGLPPINSKKFRFSIPILLAIFLLLICLGSMVAMLNFMPGTTSLSKNLAKVVNAQLDSSALKTGQGVSVSMGLSPGCKIWTFEFMTIDCGAIEVPESLVDNGFISKIVLVSLRPCDYLKNLPAIDKDEVPKYFGCGATMKHYKATVILLKITELHPEPGVTVNSKKKIGELVIKNY